MLSPQNTRARLLFDSMRIVAVKLKWCCHWKKTNDSLQKSKYINAGVTDNKSLTRSASTATDKKFLLTLFSSNYDKYLGHSNEFI